MQYPEKRIEFTINEVARACGVSRATILRMEESGFLTPYRTDPDSGYRYYDANNITQIGQYLLFMDLGLSRKEAADMYYHWGRKDAKGLLHQQRLRINRLLRLLNELELRYERANDFSFDYIDLPETACFCAETELSAIAELEAFAYSTFQNIVKEGFRVQVTEPIFVLTPAPGQNFYTVCFPISDFDRTDPRVRIFPECHALSVTAHGDYSVVNTLVEYSLAAISARRLKAAGPVRLIALVAPYVGEHISLDDFCYECVVPLEKEN